MTRRQKSPHRKLSFQSLEDRNLMAANLTVAVQNYSLIVNGDSHDSYLVIDQSGSGQYTLTAYDGATINGHTGPQTFSGVTGDFKIDLKGGKDDVFLGNDLHQITLPGNLSIKNAEQIGLEQTTVDGNFSVNSGNGGGYYTVRGSTIDGGVSMNLGSGYSQVEFQDTHIGNPNFNGGKNDFNFNQGHGGLFFDLEYTTVERDLNVKTDGSKSDTKLVGLFGGVVGRNATIQGSDAVDSISIDEFTFDKQLKITTGNGNDHVALGGFDTTNGLVNAVPPAVMSADQIFVDLGKGNDILQFGGDGTHTGGGVTANTATYLGNDGVDRVLNEGLFNLFGTFSGFESMPSMVKFLASEAPLEAVSM